MAAGSPWVGRPAAILFLQELFQCRMLRAADADFSVDQGTAARRLQLGHAAVDCLDAGADGVSDVLALLAQQKGNPGIGRAAVYKVFHQALAPGDKLDGTVLVGSRVHFFGYDARGQQRHGGAALYPLQEGIAGHGQPLQ